MAFDIKKKSSQDMVRMLLLSSIVLVPYLYFVLWPQAVGLAGILEKTGRLNAELKTAEGDIPGIANLKNSIKSYNEKIELYEKKLPAEQEIPSLLESLSRMAKEANVAIVGIAPALPAAAKKEGRLKEEPVYQEVPIVISAKSGYHELGSFLSALEKADRFMKVADIEMKANKASPKKHDVELIVCTYTLSKGK